MSTPTATYNIVSRVHVNKWDPALQRAVPGWEISALWHRSRTVLVAFVPDDVYTAEYVDTVIRQQGARDDEINALGRAPVTPSA